MKSILLVGLGGGIGSITRYISQRWFAIQYVPGFPWGTFAVNVAGCFLIGICWGLSIRSSGFTEDWKLFLMTGLCGGFTTFSAFTMEGIGLIREQKIVLFFSYVAASVVAGLLATFIGILLTE